MLIDLPATDLMLIRGGAEDLVRCDIGDTPCQPSEAEQTASGMGGSQTETSASYKLYLQIRVVLRIALSKQIRCNVSVIEVAQVFSSAWLRIQFFCDVTLSFEVALCPCLQACHWPVRHLPVLEVPNPLVKYCKFILQLFKSDCTDTAVLWAVQSVLLHLNIRILQF